MATYMLDLTGKKAAFRKIKVKKNEEKNVKGGNKDSYFKSGGFSDGVNGVGDFFGDLGQTLLGTGGDIAVGMLKGVTRTAENLGDLTGYLGGTASPYDLGASYKLKKEDLVANLTDEMWKPAVDYVDQYSVLGNKADSISEGLGQVATTILAGAAGGAAGLGTAGVTALTTGLVGTSAMGSGMSEAYASGATDEEAFKYGLIAGAAEAGTELLFGGLGKATGAVGLSKGLLSADDALAKKVSSKFSSQITKNFVEYGIKAGAEGTEEVLSGILQAIGKNVTYMPEEDLKQLLKDEHLLDQFIAGAVTSGIAQSGYIPGMQQGSLREANAAGRDFITGNTKNEQAVIDKEVESRIAEKEADGEKITSRVRMKIEEQVQKELEKGYISTDTIESILGGQTYESYKSLKEQEDSLKKEIETLENMPREKITVKQGERLQEARKQLEALDITSVKNQLSDEVSKLVTSERLSESYNEKARRSQAFEADLTQYDERQQAIIQKAIDSGILNNTNRTHEFVDMIAKISADKDVSFDFTNNQKLKESGFALEGKTVNGYIQDGNITLNVNSAKALNKVVGHEITHVLEGTNLYSELQDAIIEYAKSKGDYDARWENIVHLYRKQFQGQENEARLAQYKAELTADLVGDYLFSDEQFVNNLSAKQPNIFKKIYEEIKYLVKTVTPGSKEAKQLEKVKRAFDKVYKESAGNKNGTMQYSVFLSEEDVTGYLKAGNRRNINRQKRYDEGQKLIISSDSEFEDFIRESIKGKPDNMVAYGKVESKLVESVKEASNNEINISNYYLELLSNDVKHAYDEHSIAKEDGDLDMSVEELIDTLKNVNNGEVINAIKYKNGDQRIMLSFSSEDGKIILVELASKSAGALRLKTGWKMTNEKFEQNYKSSSNSAGNKSSIDSVRDDAASKDSIPQNSEKATPSYSISEDNKGRDNEYLKAVETGDMENVQRMVYEAAKAAGYTISSEYQGTSAFNGTAPSSSGYYETKEDAVEAWEDGSYEGDWSLADEVLRGIEMGDLTWRVGEREYRNADNLRKEAILNLRKVVNENAKEITMYRSVPNDVKENSFRNGDWITPSRSYAVDNAEIHGWGDDYNIIEQVVSIEHVWWDGNDIAEWGFDDGTEYAYKNTQNNRKLLNAVTYDDNGNIIPLSKRFDSSKKDIRYSLSKKNDIAPTGTYNVYGSDIELELPIRDDVAPVQQSAAVDDLPTREDIPTQNTNLPDDLPIRDDVKPRDVEKITTVKERNAQILDNHKIELQNNIKIREQIHDEFNRKIAELQSKYEAESDKTSMEAAGILQQIEEQKRMRDDNDAKYEKHIRDIEARIDKMSTEEFRTAEQRMTKHEEHRALMRELMGDTSTWVDKRLGLQYRVNTLRRNLRDVVRDADGKRDIARADAIYEELQGTYNQNEALLNRESSAIKQPFAELDINRYEDAYIQMLGEYRDNPDTTISPDTMKEYYEKHKDKIDLDKVEHVIKEARRVYDSLFERVNAALEEQGFKKMEYRKGYFPHFTENQGWLAKLFNWKVQDNTIPTDIAGLTEMFQPERSWQSFDKHRTGDDTDYSFMTGFDTYVNGALDWIYHINDIQKRRAFENEIRYQHSEKGVKERIEQIYANEEYDADMAQAEIDTVYREAKNPLNNLVQDIRRGTNNLAGKKDSSDRGMESNTNRQVYSVMTNISNRVSANMVAGSLSSALTNFIPITQSWGEVSPISTLKAMKETVSSKIRDDGMIDKSDFMTNRLRPAENLNKTTWDKIGEKVGFFMEAVDSFTTQTVWRSKYNENIKNGMSESEAIKNADYFAEGLMAGRSRGNMPTAFNAKNPMTKLLTAFQLEVANQYGYMFKDMPQNVGENAKGKIVKGYLEMFVGAYFYNILYSNLTGRDAALDPIGMILEFFDDLFGDDEEEGDALKAIEGLGMNVAQEVPFVGGLLGGGRVPISNALPFEGSFSDLMSAVGEGDFYKIFKEMMNPMYYMAMPMGGGQLRKTVQGLSMFDDDLPTAGSYTDSGSMRFPVDDNFASGLQAFLFGQWANENAQDYIENERTPLEEKQIQEYIDVDIPIADYWKYRDGLKEQDTLEEKFDYVAGLDLPVEKKNILINNIVDRKEKVDMKDYDKFENFEEFDFATKNPEKYDFLQKNNIPYTEYKASKASKKAYSWAYQNPEKYIVSKAVTDDIVKYRIYAKEISAIKADKDKDGNAISGSAKNKVIQHINTLDIGYGAKLILYKDKYNADDTYNYEIVEYLNNRDDISRQEMEIILMELGFTVDAEGNVTW